MKGDHGGASEARAQPSAEQHRYAVLLWWGGWAAFAALVIGFVLYAAGLLPAAVPLAGLPALWALPAREFAQASGQPAGWGWVLQLGHGDALNLGAIALLASCSALPLAGVLWLYLKRGDRLYAALAAIQIAVLVLAATGIIHAGH